MDLFSSAFDRRQLRLALLALIAFCGLLAGGYFFFLRTEYAVLFNGLRASDAAAVVAELDSKGVSYRLRDGGATILVPEGEADSVRLAVTGSEALAKGATGFELFNKSDMGLTDFAQKINYQRALQGELARTIMMMDGVADARVHLAMPERSLFRGSRSSPKAAVAVTMQRGMIADEARVAGIQRLVAAAVPDLALADVVILDELGRVISAAPSLDAGMSNDLQEHEAVQLYYRARARAAIANVLPDLKFDVRILAQTRGETGAPEAWSTTPAAPQAKSGEASAPRNFSLRISVITLGTLGREDRDLIGNAIIGALSVDQSLGDSIQFAVGPVDPVAPATTPAQLGAVPAVHPALPTEMPQGAWWSPWWVKLALALGLLILVLFIRNRPSGLSSDARDAFVARIRSQLGIKAGGGDARL
jgi:flagellar M-ring protein FliF